MEKTGLAIAYTIAVSAIFGVFLLSAVIARVVHRVCLWIENRKH